MIAREPYSAVLGTENPAEAGNSQGVVTDMVQMGIFRVVAEQALPLYNHPDMTVLVSGYAPDLASYGFAVVSLQENKFELVTDIVVAADTVVGPYPDIAVPVLYQTADIVCFKSQFISEEDIEFPAVIAVQSMTGPDPDKSTGILHDAAYAIE